MNKATILLGMMVLVAAFFGYLNRETIIEWVGNPQIPTNLLDMLTLDNILAFVKQYGVLITLVVGAATTVYGFYEKHKRTQAELRAFEVQTVASQNQEAYASLVEKLTQENKMLKQQTEGITDFSGTVSSLQEKLDDKNKEIQRVIWESNARIRQLEEEIDRLKVKVQRVPVAE